MRSSGWVRASGGHLWRWARRHQGQQQFTQRPRCLCGNAIEKPDGLACNKCFALVPQELLAELYRHQKGSDPRIAAEAAIENFLRCERARTNEVRA